VALLEQILLRADYLGSVPHRNKRGAGGGGGGIRYSENMG
jgi:hypothetical protein